MRLLAAVAVASAPGRRGGAARRSGPSRSGSGPGARKAGYQARVVRTLPGGRIAALWGAGRPREPRARLRQPDRPGERPGAFRARAAHRGRRPRPELRRGRPGPQAALVRAGRRDAALRRQPRGRFPSRAQARALRPDGRAAAYVHARPPAAHRPAADLRTAGRPPRGPADRGVRSAGARDPRPRGRPPRPWLPRDRPARSRHALARDARGRLVVGSNVRLQEFVPLRSCGATRRRAGSSSGRSSASTARAGAGPRSRRS